MFGEDENKKTMREQVVGLLLLTTLVILWSYFFIPPAPKTPSVEPATGNDKGNVQLAQNTGELRTADSSTHVSPKLEQEKQAESEDSAESLFAQLGIVLPPEEESTQVEEITLDHNDIELVFTPIGARVKYVYVYLKPNKQDKMQLVPRWRDTLDAKAVYPFGLRFHEHPLADLLDSRRWNYEVNKEQGVARFEYVIPNFLKLEKVFSFTESPFTLNMDLRVTNLSDAPFPTDIQNRVNPVLSVNWGPNVNSGDAQKGVQQTVIFERKGELLRYVTSKFTPKPDPNEFLERCFDMRWWAIRSAYFVVAMKPEFDGAQGWITGGPKHFRVGAGITGKQFQPNEPQEFRFRVYIGPNRGPLLAKAWQGLDQVWEFFTSVKVMDQFAKLLLRVLNFFYEWTVPNYGVAIILLTILVRILVFPLTWKSMVSMKKMQKLAPEVEKIKAECGNDQQEMQKRIMQLYRERGVSPLGGCLPMLLQLPVFIALYRMLWSAVELRGAPFILWMNDMSQPDRFIDLPFSIPIPFSSTPLESIHLLPILMGIAMYFSQKLMPGSAQAMQTPQQRIMMNIMPIFFSVICYNVASGLNLYILVSTLLGIAQNYLIPIKDVDVSPRGVTSGRRHFYTIAQEKKRQWAKELRRERKLKQRKTIEDKED